MELKMLPPSTPEKISILEFTASDGRKSVMYSTDDYMLTTYYMTIDEIIEKFNPSEKELEAIKRLL